MVIDLVVVGSSVVEVLLVLDFRYMAMLETKTRSGCKGFDYEAYDVLVVMIVASVAAVVVAAVIAVLSVGSISKVAVIVDVVVVS